MAWSYCCPWGRAVAKKGYDILLRALAELPPDINWRFVHIGGGPLLPGLRKTAARLLPDADIVWRGATAQEAVLAAYREADLFVLPCRIDETGDRDGLPNVLMEAQSQQAGLHLDPRLRRARTHRRRTKRPPGPAGGQRCAGPCHSDPDPLPGPAPPTGDGRVSAGCEINFSMEKDIDDLLQRFRPLVDRRSSS